MKPKTMILMVVAVVCGLGASYMTSRLIAERGPQQDAEPKGKVLVAKKKLKALTALTKPEELFVEKELPLSMIPKKAITSFDELKNKRVNKIINEEVWVTADDLVSKELDGLPAALEPGMRAVGLRVNPEALAGGFVLPGARVDIVLTTRDGEGRSEVVLQDMLILAVDMTSNKDPEKGTTMLGSTVTLAARPEEALRLRAASSAGETSFLLRPLVDRDKVNVRAVKRADLSRPLVTADGYAAESAQVQETATPKIPDLPEVAADAQPRGPVAEAPKEKEKEEPAPQVKKHILTIWEGNNPIKHTFVQESNGTWGTGANRGELEEPGEPRQPRAPRAGRQPGAPPADEKARENLAPAQKPQGLGDKLQKNSGLPPVAGQGR